MQRRPFLLAMTAPALASLSSFAASSPVTRTSVLRSADLLADVDTLQRAYEQLHPGLYRYNTAAEMRAHFDALRARFDRDRSLADAYLAFSDFAATVRCGHTYANFFNQTPVVRQALFESNDRLVPFHFRWLQRRMVVTKNFSDDPKLVPGTEVVAIDGIPASAILGRLMAVARADGGNDAKRIAYLQVQGDDRI